MFAMRATGTPDSFTQRTDRIHLFYKRDAGNMLEGHREAAQVSGWEMTPAHIRYHAPQRETPGS